MSEIKSAILEPLNKEEMIVIKENMDGKMAIGAQYILNNHNVPKEFRGIYEFYIKNKTY